MAKPGPKTLRGERLLLEELENVVRYCHGRLWSWMPTRPEADVLNALDKYREVNGLAYPTRPKPKRRRCPNCKGSGDYDGSACVRCAGGYVTSDDTREPL